MDSTHFTKAVSDALNSGDLFTANALLGTEYCIEGRVVPGLKLGRSLGFPTANLEVHPDIRLLIANGVYAVKVVYSGNSYQGMASIGFRPTLAGTDLTVEVNLYGFDGDLYGETLFVYFYYRIRDEKKFNSLEELTREIICDKQKVLELFSHLNHPDSHS